MPHVVGSDIGQPKVAPVGVCEQEKLPLQVKQAPQLVPIAAGSQVPPLHVPE